MSIEIDNPKSVLGKMDAAANLIEQMFLSKMTNDDKRFNYAHEKAGKLLFDAKEQYTCETGIYE